jgi:hypothetical protein
MSALTRDKAILYNTSKGTELQPTRSAIATELKSIRILRNKDATAAVVVVVTAAAVRKKNIISIYLGWLRKRLGWTSSPSYVPRKLTVFG